MNSEWNEAALPWIANLGEHGDFGRQFVLDPVMRARVQRLSTGRALDVGCGEGRFTRFIRSTGLHPIGMDISEALIAEAKNRDPDGDYRTGNAESLEFENNYFDLVVAYNSLINIENLASAIAEIARVLRPGGTFLVSNLTSFTSACADLGWVRDAHGNAVHYPIDNYLNARSVRVDWRGIRVLNYHRPLSTYMKILLGCKLRLEFFDEPEPRSGGDQETTDRNRRVPLHMIMEWRKPEE